MLDGAASAAVDGGIGIRIALRSLNLLLVAGG